MDEESYTWEEDLPVFHADDFGNDDALKPKPPTGLKVVLG